MYRRFTVVAFFALIVASLPALAARASDGIHSGDRQLQASNATPLAAGRVTGPAARAMQQGALPSDAAELVRLKAQAASEGGQTTTPPEATGPQGTIVAGASKPGLFDPSGAPSDSTGAIGTASYIEVVNSKVGLFNRTTLAPGVSATLGAWWATGSANVFDPQVIWDPTTNRFYYTGDAVVSNNENYLAFGWSKTSAPANFATTSWCKYFVRWDDTSVTPAIGYFPDFPKLGDSQSFIHVGVNTYKGNPFVGSDLISIAKPAAGTTCAAGSTLKLYGTFGLKIGTAAQFTPVPANEIDTSATGYVVTRALSLPSTKIGVFKVTKSAAGAAVVTAVGTATVPSYTAPANAPQSSTIALIDTSDARMTQAVAAVDPAHTNQFTVWTQHTVKGGAGAMVRWYEINPATRVVVQTGVVSSASLFYFNGAISPDRLVRGALKAFGGSMVLNFNSSSKTTFPKILMQSKRGTAAVSALTLVKASPGPIIEFNCKAAAPNNVCRWGDYAAATPDPLAPTTGTPKPTLGFVYNTSQWTKDSRLQTTKTVNWQTWNWKAKP